MKVAIWPNGDWCYVEDLPEMSHLSDDYRIRECGFCPQCYGAIIPHYGEPIAECECGAREWYK